MKHIHDLQITYPYDREFDELHYPIKTWMREVILRIHNLLELADDVEWFYYATIHGVIFTCYRGKGSNRIGVDCLKMLGEIEGLRWVEFDKNQCLSIGLCHSLEVSKN